MVVMYVCTLLAVSCMEEKPHNIIINLHTNNRQEIKKCQGKPALLPNEVLSLTEGQYCHLTYTEGFCTQRTGVIPHAGGTQA